MRAPTLDYLSFISLLNPQGGYYLLPLSTHLALAKLLSLSCFSFLLDGEKNTYFIRW